MKFATLGLVFSGNVMNTLADITTNDVFFKNAGSVSYALESQSHTSGGDFKVSWGDNKVTIETERKHETANAEFFKDKLGPSNMVGDDVNGDQSPDELNFAVKGSLTLNVGGFMVTCDDIRLGQGHRGRRLAVAEDRARQLSTNNWWLGGSNCMKATAKSGDPLTCQCQQGAVVKFDNSGTHEFVATLENKCGLIESRQGFWATRSAAAGETLTWKYTTTKKEYKENDFMESLSTHYAGVVEFGEIEMDAEEADTYITKDSSSSTTDVSCAITIPDGMQLWQWSYEVSLSAQDCSPGATLNTCHFMFFPIGTPTPCCIGGYQSPEYDKCTEPGHNMCLKKGENETIYSPPTPITLFEAPDNGTTPTSTCFTLNLSGVVTAWFIVVTMMSEP